jgi:cytochrome d ubiquinol oxidase subunit I
MVFELRLLIRYVRGGVASALPELAQNPDDDDDKKPDDVLSFAY